MTVVVARQIPLLPAGAPVTPPGAKSTISQLNGGNDAKAKPSLSGKESRAIRRRRERPCDACRKRKSKCIANEGQENVCAACSVREQVCTYVEDPQPRKKRQEIPAKDQENLKLRSVGPLNYSEWTNITKPDPFRRSAVTITWIDKDERPIVKREQESMMMVFPDNAPPQSPNLTPWGSPQNDGIHVGHTTELESVLFDIYQASGQAHDDTRYQKHDDRNAFLHRGPEDHSHHHQILSAYKTIEELVHPYGPFLVQKYRATINPNLLVVEDAFFTLYNTHQKGGLDPVLVAAIYTLTLSTEEGHQLAPSSSLDVPRVEELAFQMFATSLDHPSLSTIQAGILLMQTPHVDSRTLNSQLVGMVFDLGLHVDSSAWVLSNKNDNEEAEAEQHSLRKRLAWAVYVQDKWCSLIHGRPSLIPAEHWAVQDPTERDFYSYSHSGCRTTRKGGSSEAEGSDCCCPPAASQEHLRGLTSHSQSHPHSDPDAIHQPDHQRSQALLTQMIHLTKILSTILDKFYTLQSQRETAREMGMGIGTATQMILERAKPVQIRLKNWFAGLPASLKMEMESNCPGGGGGGGGGGGPSAGSLHLAYFATEIILHRCIVRSLSSYGSHGLGSHSHSHNLGEEIYLSYVCRSAAKTRLISAMDFTNRLHPAHLASFWYFPSAVNFALIGAFGNLLRATSAAQEEAEFYRRRLAEYRWTLCVSSTWAPFLGFAIEALDASAVLLENSPAKPSTAELVAKLPPPPVAVTLPMGGSITPPADEIQLTAEASLPLITSRGDPFPNFSHPCDESESTFGMEMEMEMGVRSSAPSGLISPSTSTSSTIANSNSNPNSSPPGSNMNMGSRERPEELQQGRGTLKRVRLDL